MSELHIDDDILDQYALGTLPVARLAGVEEHLLICEACQSRLEAADEFAIVFRAAAVQPDAGSQRSWHRFWNHPLWNHRLWNQRPASWMVLAAGALAVLLFAAGPFRRPPTAMVSMQSLRGPDAPAQVKAGRPALLVFDIVPAAGVNEYKARIVNPVGTEILAAEVSVKDGRLTALANKLPPGSYWVRVFRTDDPEPIAEYGLRAR